MFGFETRSSRFWGGAEEMEIGSGMMRDPGFFFIGVHSIIAFYRHWLGAATSRRCKLTWMVSFSHSHAKWHKLQYEQVKSVSFNIWYSDVKGGS